MPRSMFPEISTEETERSKNRKGFKGPGGEHIKHYGQHAMSVTTLEGFVRKSTCQHPTSSKLGTTFSSGSMRRTSGGQKGRRRVCA